MRLRYTFCTGSVRIRRKCFQYLSFNTKLRAMSNGQGPAAEGAAHRFVAPPKGSKACRPFSPFCRICRIRQASQKSLTSEPQFRHFWFLAKSVKSSKNVQQEPLWKLSKNLQQSKKNLEPSAEMMSKGRPCTTKSMHGAEWVLHSSSFAASPTKYFKCPTINPKWPKLQPEAFQKRRNK